MYIKIGLIAVGILFVFRILAFLNKILPFSNNVKHYVTYALPLAELALWLSFVVWSIKLIYNAEAYITLTVLGILVLLIVIPTWFLVRDFLYGLLLKMQRKIETDDKIEIGNLKGIIIKTDRFTFDIKTSNGNINTIPYNKIRSEIITKSGTNIHLEKHIIPFKISTKQNINPIIRELKVSLLTAPWVAASQEPIITIVNHGGDNYDLEVIVYVLKKEYVEKITEYVKLNYLDKIPA